MTIKATLRDGNWVTPERIRIYSLMMLAVLLGTLMYLAATAEGLNDYLNRPLGTDFSNVYAAGTYAREGEAPRAFDPPEQYEREQQIFGEHTPFYGWHYPPFFLLLAAPLAALPYVAALSVWLIATLSAYVASLALILPRRLVMLPALGFTAVWVNATHGNNGFLTAALFAAALACLPLRPLLAGVFFGCLAYKPQYGLLIPIALLMGGYWRTIASASLTVLLLTVVVTSMYGNAIWPAFLDALPFTRIVVLEQGNTGFYKMQSLFAWIRDLGGSISLAYVAQGLLTISVVFIIARLWRSPVAFERKAAALILGSLLVTPYSLDYDLMLLAPAIAFLVAHGRREGFLPYEISLLFLAALLPIAVRPIAQHTYLFLGAVSIFMLFVWSVRPRVARQEYGKLPA